MNKQTSKEMVWMPCIAGTFGMWSTCMDCRNMWCLMGHMCKNKIPTACCTTFLWSLLVHALVPCKQQVTPSGNGQPSSFSFHIDGRPLICDKNGAHIIDQKKIQTLQANCLKFLTNDATPCMSALTKASYPLMSAMQCHFSHPLVKSVKFEHYWSYFVHEYDVSW